MEQSLRLALFLSLIVKHVQVLRPPSSPHRSPPGFHQVLSHGIVHFFLQV